jgi:hypothetical protein
MFHGICREVSFMNIDETDTTKLCDVVLVWKLFWEFLSKKISKTRDLGPILRENLQYFARKSSILFFSKKKLLNFFLKKLQELFPKNF